MNFIACKRCGVTPDLEVVNELSATYQLVCGKCNKATTPIMSASSYCDEETIERLSIAWNKINE